MFNNLSDFIDFLEEKNELVRISTPVSSELEITEIAETIFTSFLLKRHVSPTGTVN